LIDGTAIEVARLEAATVELVVTPVCIEPAPLIAGLPAPIAFVWSAKAAIATIAPLPTAAPTMRVGVANLLDPVRCERMSVPRTFVSAKSVQTRWRSQVKP
jgi:hypothetical protein